MCTVLDSVSQQPALVAQLEDVCFPILQKMISENGQDVFEEVCRPVLYHRNELVFTNVKALRPVHRRQNEPLFTPVGS